MDGLVAGRLFDVQVSITPFRQAFPARMMLKGMFDAQTSQVPVPPKYIPGMRAACLMDAISGEKTGQKGCVIMID